MDGKEPRKKLPIGAGTPRAPMKQCAPRGRMDSNSLELPGNDLDNVRGLTEMPNNKTAPVEASVTERSFIVTTEPYEPEVNDDNPQSAETARNWVNSRNQGRGPSKNQQRSSKRKNELIKQALRAEETRPPSELFPRYFTLRFPRIDIETELDNITAQREILQKVGRCDGPIKKQSRDTLLIKVNSRQQGEKLRQVQNIAGNAVVVREHGALNQSKGTVYSRAMSNSSLQSLKDALANQHVVEIERMKTKVNGQLQDTHRYILTFNRPDPPGIIKLVDWHCEPVELYIPRPMRCTKCWKIGHTQKRCRRQIALCLQCSEEGHHSGSCDKEAKCVNCGDNHRSTDKQCPAYIFRSEVLATQVRMKYGYKEAEEDARERFHASGKRHTFNNRPQSRLPGGAQHPPRADPPHREEQDEEHRFNASDLNSIEQRIRLIRRGSDNTHESENNQPPANRDAVRPRQQMRIQSQREAEDIDGTIIEENIDKETRNENQTDDENVQGTPQMEEVPNLELVQVSQEALTINRQVPPTLVEPSGLSEEMPTVDVSQIPLPGATSSSEDTEAEDTPSINTSDHHYDPWEDKVLPGPSPTSGPPKAPPGVVAKIIKKIECTENDGLKTATEEFGTKKLQSPEQKKATRRKLKRKRLSLEKAQTKRKKESTTHPIPVIGNAARTPAVSKKYQFNKGKQ